jgi:two-component system, sensor histidine kinase
MSEISRLKKALEEERAARRIADQDSQAKSELLATVSHELRTPMGAIISMADLLLTTALNPTQRKYADTLQQSTRGLLAVLNDILDFSKLNASAFQLNLQALDLSEFLDSIETALRAHAGAKGLSVEVQRGKNLPRHIVADSARIRQVLNNLTSNAVKFTDAGTITLNIDCTPDGSSGGTIRVEVSDTGEGITELERARLFKRFSQGNLSLTEDRKGTGLGLAIARGLTEKMGGNLDFSSIPGSGSTFWFTAKFRFADESAENQLDSKNLVSPPVTNNQGKILIVDDNKVNQMLISAFLEKFGFGFNIAGSGQEAIEMALAESYKVILMDIRMPGMDGMETTRMLHEQQSDGLKTPVVALTAHAIEGSRQACIDAGMSGFVTKPIDPRSLLAAITEHLKPDADAPDNHGVA